MIARRFLFILLTAFAVFALTKAMVRAIPGDPIDTIAGETGTSLPREALARELGLDRPYLPSLAAQTAAFARGDWGTSLFQRVPLRPLLQKRLLASLELAALALSFGVALSVALALGATLPGPARPALARLVEAHSAIVAASPIAWLGPLFAWFLAVRLPIFELGGAIGLPAFTLGLSLSGFWSRMLYETLRDELGADHVKMARAKGLPEWKVVLRHALAPRLGAYLGYLGTQIGSLVAGAVVTESIFDWPGMGSLLIESVFRRDYPTIEASIFCTSILILLGGLLGDLAQAGFDPRLRER